MPKVSTKTKVSPGRVPHTGRRPKARVIGPDVLCAQPKPPKKPRKPRVKKLPAIVAGPPPVPPAPVPPAPVSGSAVRSMASSLVAAKLHVVKNILKDEASIFKTMDIFQIVLFICAMVFLGKDLKGLAYSALAIGTFAPMLIRRGLSKWRDSLIP